MRFPSDSPFVSAMGLAVVASSAACNGDGGAAALTNGDQTTLAAMTLLATSLPASPTNAHADDPNSAALGRLLFFDKRMSEDGTVACASCHDPANGFSDTKPLSQGVAGRFGTRHSMPVTAAALHPFLFWDGRVDSVWSQPLKAIEGHAEMDFTRVEVARFVASQYGSQYEVLFGGLPDLANLPARAAPGMAEWDAMSPAAQDQINRAFSNVGKALEAYERKLLCTNTRFDQYVRGEIALNSAESAGAADFVGGGCTRCHSGPSFSDGKFHNIGSGDQADVGRAAGIPKLLADVFNGAGVYSDDTAAGKQLLAGIQQETNLQGAFRTASLRGAGQRTSFGHQGNHASLHDFIDEVYDRGGRGGRSGNVGNAGLDPLLNGVDPRNVDDVVAFIHTLDCPTPPPELLAP